MKIQDWYTDWFNTPYYHILYKERNDKDAQLFMKNITSFLKLPKKTLSCRTCSFTGRETEYEQAYGRDNSQFPLQVEGTRGRTDHRGPPELYCR